MKFVRFASALFACILPASGLRAAEGVTWPGISAGEAFLKEQWPAGRVLVWAKPGTSGDALRASNWLEYESAADYLAGKPVKNTAVFGGADTDLILPDSRNGQPYIVGFGKKDIHENYDNEPPRFVCRHVKIGKGAALDGCPPEKAHLDL